MLYRIFDILIDSNIPLPELPEVTKGTARILFQLSGQRPYNGSFDWRHHWRFSDGTVCISVARTGKGYCLRFPGLADFSTGDVEADIVCHPCDDIPDETIRHLLLDQVIPRLLAHEGNTILHASAVAIDGRAIAFAGETGMGKSTLAASLHARGHPVLSDDSLLLLHQNHAIAGIPGYRDRKSTRLNSSHIQKSRMPSSA